jgi:hypothetical protein
MRFQRRRFFRNQTYRKQICLWWPCLITDRIEMAKLYRGPIKDASYQVSVQLVKRFQSRIYFIYNWPIRNKNCLWRPCLLMDRDEMSNLNRGPFIDALCQVRFTWPYVFEEKIFVKSTNRKQVMFVAAMLVIG